MIIRRKKMRFTKLKGTLTIALGAALIGTPAFAAKKAPDLIKTC